MTFEALCVQPLKEERRRAQTVITHGRRQRGAAPLFTVTGRKKPAWLVRDGQFHKAFSDKVLFYPALLFFGGVGWGGFSHIKEMKE